MFLKMFFIFLSNIDIKFGAKRIIWRLYTTIKVLFTIRQVKFIDKKKIIKLVLDKKFKTFEVYVIALEVSEMAIYLF